MRPLSFSWPGSAIRRHVLSTCIFGLAAISLPIASFAEDTGQAPATDVAAGAFERLKALEGTWRVADKTEHPLRISFYPTARGSTLVESWDVNGRSHSMTIYHRDGDTLLVKVDQVDGACHTGDRTCFDADLVHRFDG